MTGNFLLSYIGTHYFRRSIIINQMIKADSDHLLKSWIKMLLDNNFPEGEKKLVIKKIQRSFSEITEVKGNQQEEKFKKFIYAEKGVAVPINQAVACFFDYSRTIRLVQGIVQKIKSWLKENPQKVLHIFYAGCGPYAPLFCLTAPLFPSSLVKYSILEINKDALSAAKILIQKLSLDDYVVDYYLEDAVTFNIPNAKQYDILISETLNKALYNECFVPILLNLLPQLSNDIVVIPEDVIIDASLVKREELPNGRTTDIFNTQEPFTKLGQVISVRESINQYLQKKQKSDPFFTISYSLPDLERYHFFTLDTTVKITEKLYLRRNDSELTSPAVMDIQKEWSKKEMVFTYALEEKLELKFKII